MVKTILITGSSRGIGKAIAELAHKQGYRVIVHGKTNSEGLNQVHESLKGSIKTSFDVADKEATHRAVGRLLKEFRMIDVLVNNAGVALNRMKDIGNMDEEKALEEWRTNVLGTIYCTQAVLPAMLKKGNGSVINMGSFKGIPNFATMSTFTFAQTKSAVISMTKSLAKTYSARGIRFNVVLPCYVETDQVKSWDEETFKRISEGTILGRMAKPEEIAPLVMFLASDNASFITGSEFLIDGGYSIKGK